MTGAVADGDSGLVEGVLPAAQHQTSKQLHGFLRILTALKTLNPEPLRPSKTLNPKPLRPSKAPNPKPLRPSKALNPKPLRP